MHQETIQHLGQAFPKESVTVCIVLTLWGLDKIHKRIKLEQSNLLFDICIILYKHFELIWHLCPWWVETVKYVTEWCKVLKWVGSLKLQKHFHVLRRLYSPLLHLEQRSPTSKTTPTTTPKPGTATNIHLVLTESFWSAAGETKTTVNQFHFLNGQNKTLQTRHFSTPSFIWKHKVKYIMSTWGSSKYEKHNL